MRLPLLAASFALCAVVSPGRCRAEARQLQLSLRGGFATSGGRLAAPSGALELGGWYGLSDAFSLYAEAGYSAGPLGADVRHGGWLSLGAVYALDVVRVVPFVGLGARFDAIAGADQLVLAPSAELRGGLYYLLRRGLALELQAAYAFPFVGRDLAADLVSVTLGVRFIGEP